MTRYIDADALKKKAMFGTVRQGTIYETSIRVIPLETVKNAPTADVVEVVRCRDCKYRYDDLCPMYYVEEISWDNDGWTETDHAVHDLTNDDDFCSRGERRSE